MYCNIFVNNVGEFKSYDVKETEDTLSTEANVERFEANWRKLDFAGKDLVEWVSVIFMDKKLQEELGELEGSGDE